ncbi:heterokaryon incompatibility protein-domain-containing protein [Lineolata rhizophorae]|uniref:Heterokaryon incompatibility protein-domain-containing protein n=1 Tax=Lineolata rhizophorae TaxID=578093 RepID=A0A6A6NXT1_9PEZI|nr:heterokaryon incompatibility protein-domain-containing protein [Lineolata rhizophorae]
MATVSSNEFGVQDIPQHNKSFYDDDLRNTPPKTIRLLGIHPGLFADRLVCCLQTVSSLLKDHQQTYHALSYSWTDQPGWKNISLNGKSDFRIGKSLFSALRRLRLRNDLRWVWTDQICINQANLEEKDEQVSMMGDIYRQADLVCVWLGPCGHTNREAGEEEAEDCLAHVVHKDGTVDFGRRGLEVVQLCEARVEDKSQWWWRMWVVQEIVLAKEIKVLVGAHEFPSLTTAVKALGKSWIDKEPGHVARGITRRQWQQMPSRRARNDAYIRLLSLHTTKGAVLRGVGNVYDLLHLTAAQHAGLAKDKIYALLALVDKKRCSFDIEVQYKRPDEEVYMDVTEYLLNEKRSLDPLYEHWPRRRSPSWALDFSTGLRKAECLVLHVRPKLPSCHNQASHPNEEPKCRASRDGSNPVFRREGGCLLVRGFRFAIVVSTVQWDTSSLIVKDNSEIEMVSVGDIRDGKIEVMSHADEEVDPSDKLGTLTLRWLEDFYWKKKEQCHPGLASSDQRGSQKAWLSSIDQTEQFARTITADKYLHDKHGKEISTGDFLPHQPGFQDHKRSFDFRSQAYVTLANRTFFATDLGLCGIAGSTEVQPRDIVVVLSGASMPVILRPMPSGENDATSGFQLIGECFVSGIMYGELMEGDGSILWAEEDFRLE